MWPGILVGCGMYGGVVLLMARNTRYQEKIMDKLKKEAPLEDLVHSMVPLFFTHHRIRTFNDTVVAFAPILVLALAFVYSEGGEEGGERSRRTSRFNASGPLGYGVGAWLQHEARIPELVLEFGALALYKMCVCVATRLPPATQSDNIRTHLNGLIATSSWLDYGISGHSGLTILLWLHLRSGPALALAVLQSVLMVITREHYTLDVMHAWVFCAAVVGAFSSYFVHPALNATTGSFVQSAPP